MANAAHTLANLHTESRRFPPPEGVRRPRERQGERSTPRLRRIDSPSGRTRPARFEWAHAVHPGPRLVGRCPSPAGSTTARSTRATTPWTATCAEGRGDRVAFYFEGEPGDTQTASPTPTCSGACPARRQRARRPSESARATASPSTCRRSPRPSSSMLACARIGAIHSVIFGGFSAGERAPAHRRRRGEARHHR